MIRAVLGALLAVLATPAQAADPIAGQYEARKMEVGAFLDLKPDGRFEYGLAYGALDEQATGVWRREGDAVILDGDPVNEPRFTAEGQATRSPRGHIRFKLLLPEGMEPQYFDVLLIGTNADAEPDLHQIGIDGDVDIMYDKAHPPRALRVLLRIYDLASAEFPLDLAKDGAAMTVRFAPNDLGRVAFKGERMAIDAGRLVLTRFGEQIPFVRRDGD